MERANESRNARNRCPAPRAWMWLAVGAILTSITITAALVRGLHHRSRGDLGRTEVVPGQSEPDLESESMAAPGNSRSPVASRGNIELTGHTVDAPDNEADSDNEVRDGTPDKDPKREPSVPFYSSADLDELQNAETAAANGDWAAAAKAYAAITMNPPVPIDAWYHRAVACLKIGDRETYCEICNSLLSRVEMNPLHLPPINLVAWICALGPDAVADLILKRLPDEPTARHAYLNTIGGVYLRAGRYEEAVKHLRDGIAVTNDGGAKQDWLLLALAYHHLGRAAEARRSLDSMPADSPLNRRDSVWDSAEIELLQQEVTQALAGRP